MINTDKNRIFADFKHRLRKVVLGGLILFTLIQSFPLQVFGQEATSSAQINYAATVSASLNNSPFNDVFVNPSLAPTSNTSSYITPVVFPVFDTVGLLGSASLSIKKNKKWTKAPNTKHDLRGDEAYQVEVNDISSQDMNAEVLDAKGNKAAVDLEKIDTANGMALTILPPKNFKPGKYTLKLTDSSGNVQTQDFTWGVLAINTNKSIYLLNEKADLAMAVLDDTGNMVCDANVELRITNQELKIDDVLSTSNGKIIVNPDCKVHGYTAKPDYEASYQTSMAGVYNMTLTADTKNGTRTINDAFQVQDSVSFDVERSTGTRIYPPAEYPVNFNIKVNKDFKGQVIEYVPSSFQVFPASQGASFTVKNIAAPIASSTNTFGTFLNLGLPYKGSVLETLGFGQHLLDPQEKDLYSNFGLSGHDGLDFEMPIGTPVYSTDDGVVAMAGGQIYGTTVVVQHAWGRSYYGHLSKVNVALGQKVSKGQVIGLSGNTGISTGPHLHFSIKLNANDFNNGYYGKTDPSPYLSLSNNSAVLGASTINDTIKAIVWDVNVKKGDTLNLSYFFKTPNVSPYFYTLGPLSFVQNEEVIFKEARQWQLANDVVFPATSYLDRNTSTIITSTVSWQIVTTAPSAGATTTSCKNAKTTGYCQETPGAANTTNGLTIPTVPNGKGFIYDTVLNSTIPTGTWTFNIKTTSSSATGTGFITVCAWKVTVSAGAITGSTNFINCVDGTTNVQSSISALASSISVTSVPPQSFSSSEYLYVEYWLHTTVAGGSATGKVTFNAGEGAAEDIVTPGSSSNLAPNAPSQDSPANSATGISVTPTFLMTATDPESNNLQYKVTIYSDACTTAVQTNDQSVSQTGWTGQNATCVSGSDCYTSGTQSSYATQTALSNSTQYWWRASAKDPQGSNTFTNSSTCNTFTTQAAGPTLDQLLRHGKWFNSSGVIQPFTF